MSAFCFTYTFSEGTGNDDQFYVKLFNGATGAILREYSVDRTSAGIICWSLLGMSPSVSLLGLEFQLRSWDLATDSSVKISNVKQEVNAPPVLLSCAQSQVPYNSLGQAYTDAVDGCAIKVRAEYLTETVELNKATVLTITGGYDAAFGTIIGMTTLKGMTVVKGRSIVSGIAIQ